MMDKQAIRVSLKKGTKTVYILSVGGEWSRRVDGAAAVTHEVAEAIRKGFHLDEEGQKLMLGLQEMTPAQRARQYVRERNGQYAENLKCYCCDGRVPTDNYCSDKRTDTEDSEGNSWGDVALFLCRRCCSELDKLPDGQAFRVASGLEPRPWAGKPRSKKVRA